MDLRSSDSNSACLPMEAHRDTVPGPKPQKLATALLHMHSEHVPIGDHLCSGGLHKIFQGLLPGTQNTKTAWTRSHSWLGSKVFSDSFPK